MHLRVVGVHISPNSYELVTQTRTGCVTDSSTTLTVHTVDDSPVFRFFILPKVTQKQSYSRDTVRTSVGHSLNISQK